LRLVQTNDLGHQPTFASSVVNGKVARLPAVREVAMELLGSILSSHSLRGDRDSKNCRSPPPIYLCSLGTNTVLGNSTNGLFGVLLDDGPDN
jgi:hypothetical protein